MAYASNANLVLEGSAAILGIGAIATSSTGVGGGVLGVGAAGAAAGAKLASVVSIGAYGYDYLKTGNTSSLVGAGASVVSLASSGVATSVTGNIMRSGRMFGNLSAPQAARLTVRTLQQMLDAEDMSITSLLNETRMQISMQYRSNLKIEYWTLNLPHRAMPLANTGARLHDRD